MRAKSLAISLICSAFVSLAVSAKVVLADDPLASIAKQSPALYQGVLRALGREQAEKFFDHWTDEDVQIIQDKLYTHQKLAIEYITHPDHPDGELPRSFALNLFGPLAEALGLAQFRKECPEGFRVVGDDGKIRSDLAGLRRPDGLMIRVDPSNENQIQIAGILESKVSKNNAESFDPIQYSEMLHQWQKGGLFVDGKTFLPEKILVQVNDRFVPVTELSVADFFSAIYLYQPRSSEAPSGLKKLLVGSVDGWQMRYAGFSVASLGAYPYLPDRFEEYENDVKALIREMRSSPEALSDLAKRLISKYSEEKLMAAFSVLAPEWLEKIKLSRRKVGGRQKEGLIHQDPKFALREYVENRFYETVKRFGGRSLYFLLVLSLKAQKDFLSHSTWRPSIDELNAHSPLARDPEVWLPRWRLLDQAGFLKSPCESWLVH